MEDHDLQSLKERLSRLENSVQEIRQAVREISVSRGAPAQPVSQPQASQAPASPQPSTRPVYVPPPRKSFTVPAHMRKGEFWLSRVGIGLLLFGVLFLFKYSIEQGWITPWLRVVFGIAVGCVLFYFGLQFYSARKAFARVMMGGGIATFYITGFAAFQLLELVSFGVAMTYMVIVTLIAFVLSLRQDDAVLSIIGATGGLATPFLLYTDSGSIPGLMLYTCLILACTGAIYFFKGWRSLMWLSIVGGWIVMAIGLDEVLPGNILEAGVDVWSVQGGIIFAWLSFWALPVVRELFCVKFPERCRPSSIGFGDKSLSKPLGDLLSTDLHIYTIGVPLITLGMMTALWPQVEETTWGLVALGLTAVYLGGYNALRPHVALRSLSYTHFLSSMVLLTVALAFLFDGDVLLLALATEAVAIHVVAKALKDTRTSYGAHLLFVFLTMWMLFRFSMNWTHDTPIFNMTALSNLWAILAAFVASIFLRTSIEKNIYRIAAHIGALGWLAYELSRFANGDAWVSVSWGIYGAVLLILGLRLDINRLRLTALGTLALLVGKLFLIDLARLETIWRVLLFIGMGGAFLVLSFYFKSLWKGDGGKPMADS